MKRNWNWAVWTGAALVFLGVISYPLFFVRFPALRDFPWANLPMVALGSHVRAYAGELGSESVITPGRASL